MIFNPNSQSFLVLRGLVSRGDFGRLGHGDCNDVFVPRPIEFFSGRLVNRVACGDTHTLVVAGDGQLFTFGRNQNGQLGLGHTNDCLSPQLVESLQVRAGVRGVGVRALMVFPQLNSSRGGMCRVDSENILTELCISGACGLCICMLCISSGCVTEHAMLGEGGGVS